MDCGLGFLNPRPNIEEIGRFYPPEFFLDFSDNDHSNRYAEQARYLDDIAMSVPKPKLLDIGCANGDFPRFMLSKGWEVEGLETANNSLAIDDFKVYRTPFPESDIPINYFDAVTAWAVLEHVHDPMAYFKKAYDALRPGGRLIFLVTNFKSLASKRLFREDIPRHLYFFTPDTIRSYIGSYGFKLMALDFHDKIFSLHSSFWLFWLVKKTVGHPFTYLDIPMSYEQEINKFGWSISAKTKLYYSLRHPLLIIDQMFRPIFDRYAMKAKNYGIMTCVAEKL